MGLFPVPECNTVLAREILSEKEVGEFFHFRLGAPAATLVPQFSISDPQQVFPLPDFAFEAHALGNLKGGDDASLDCLAALACPFAG